MKQQPQRPLIPALPPIPLHTPTIPHHIHQSHRRPPRTHNRCRNRILQARNQHRSDSRYLVLGVVGVGALRAVEGVCFAGLGFESFSCCVRVRVGHAGGLAVGARVEGVDGVEDEG